MLIVFLDLRMRFLGGKFPSPFFFVYFLWNPQDENEHCVFLTLIINCGSFFFLPRSRFFYSFFGICVLDGCGDLDGIMDRNEQYESSHLMQSSWGLIEILRVDFNWGNRSPRIGCGLGT